MIELTDESRESLEDFLSQNCKSGDASASQVLAVASVLLIDRIDQLIMLQLSDEDSADEYDDSE